MLIAVKDNPSIAFEKDWSDFRDFAIKKHGKQMYGDLPYAYHLAKVESVLAEFGFSDHDYRAAAWLHDIIEDTPVTLKEVSAFYGERIASLVWACTGEGANRKERNESIYKKLKTIPDAAPIKVADRLVNINESIKAVEEGGENKLEMYIKEWEDFKANVGPLMEVSPQHWFLFDTLSSAIEFAKKKG